jgi:hypothetical protein
MSADMLIPIGERVVPKAEDGLHVVSHHADWQDIGSVIDDRVLSDRTVLIFVDEQVRIAGRNDVIYMLILEQIGSRCAYSRVIQPTSGEYGWVAFCPLGKCRDEADRPTVNC